MNQLSAARELAKDPRVSRQQIGGGKSRPLQGGDNIKEISIFKLFEMVQKPNGPFMSGSFQIPKNDAALRKCFPNGTTESLAQYFPNGTTGTTYSYFERYAMLLKDEDAFVGDVDDDYKNCRLKVTTKNNTGYNDSDDDTMVGPYRLTDYQLYYKEPTREKYGANATAETIKNNLMAVFPKNVSMSMHTDDEEEDEDEAFPPPNPLHVQLVVAKCLHLLVVTDLLDLLPNNTDIRGITLKILKRFFLTKVDLYLPKVTNQRWKEITKSAKALRDVYVKDNTLAPAKDNSKNIDKGVLPVTVKRSSFEEFHKENLATNVSYRNILEGIQDDIINLYVLYNEVAERTDEHDEKLEEIAVATEGLAAQHEEDMARIIEDIAQHDQHIIDSVEQSVAPLVTRIDTINELVNGIDGSVEQRVAPLVTSIDSINERVNGIGLDLQIIRDDDMTGIVQRLPPIILRIEGIEQRFAPIDTRLYQVETSQERESAALRADIADLKQDRQDVRSRLDGVMEMVVENRRRPFLCTIVFLVVMHTIFVVCTTVALVLNWESVTSTGMDLWNKALLLILHWMSIITSAGDEYWASVKSIGYNTWRELLEFVIDVWTRLALFLKENGWLE